LNGHEWAKRQAQAEGLAFTELANGFASCPDPARLKELIDGSLPDDQRATLILHLDGCESCQRVLEQATSDLLVQTGLGARLQREGLIEVVRCEPQPRRTERVIYAITDGRGTEDLARPATAQAVWQALQKINSRKAA